MPQANQQATPSAPVVMTTPQPNPSAASYEVAGNFDVVGGALGVTLFFGLDGKRSAAFGLSLSDAPLGSVGLKLNPTPQSANDTYVAALGMGGLNALTNAVANYRGAPTHAAGLKAVLLGGIADGWLDPSLVGQ